MQSLLGVSAESATAASVISKLFANWTSALFYIVAEVYSSVSVGILFWQFANDVVPVSQAKRFYPLFAQMSGLAPIVAGQYVVRYASRSKDFRVCLQRQTRMVTLAGVMICLFYKWSNAYIENTRTGKTDYAARPSKEESKKKSSRPGLLASVKFLASSEYLRLIATLVLGYGEKLFFALICE